MCVLVVPLINVSKESQFTFLSFNTGEPREGEPVLWENDDFSCLFLPLPPCWAILTCRFFFVQGTALGGINPAMFVLRRTLHASQNSEHTVKYGTKVFAAEKLVRCVPEAMHPNQDVLGFRLVHFKLSQNLKTHIQMNYIKRHLK